MSRKVRDLFVLSALASLGFLAPCHAMAGNAIAANGWITIDDAGLTNGNSSTLLASLVSAGYAPPANPGNIGVAIVGGSITFTNETPTTFGAVDIHFDYFDTQPLSPGATSTVNFNIFGPNEPLSDTLSITFTGISETSPFFVNTRVSLQFRSDNDVLTLTQLANGINITETGSYQDLSTQVASATALTGFHVRFASDVEPVPLPSAVWSGAALLCGMGVLGIVRRRNRAVA